MIRKKRIKMFCYIIVLILFSINAIRGSPIKAAATVVAQKTKEVAQTQTYSVHVNDNLIDPTNSIFTGSNFSYLDGMVGKFSFDGLDKTTIVNTINGQSYGTNGTLIEETNKIPQGVNLNHLNFNSSSVAIPMSSMGFDGSQDTMTISFYLRIDNPSGSEMPITINGGPRINLFQYGSKFGLNTGNSDIYGANVSLSTSYFTHVLMTLHKNNSAATELYINGTKQTSSYVLGSSSLDSLIYFNGTLNINSPSTTYRYSTANMDEVCVWNRALNQDEINTVATFYGADYQFDDFYRSGPSTKFDTYSSGGFKDNGYISMIATGTGASRSGTALVVKGLKANTNYTFSFYYQTPSGSSTNPLDVLINNGPNSAVLHSSIDYGMASTWTRASIPFTTGADGGIYVGFIRNDIPIINIGCLKLEEGSTATLFLSYGQEVTYDFSELPEASSFGITNSISYSEAGYLSTTLTSEKMKFTPSGGMITHSGKPILMKQGFTKQTTGTFSTNSDSNFPSSYTINENGYTGTIPRISTVWTPNWVTGRQTYLSGDIQSSSTDYYAQLSDWSYPSSVVTTYFDTPSGKNIVASLPLISTPYVINSRVTTDSYTSLGRSSMYDPYNHSTLGWMSNNSSTYYGGAESYSDASPRRPIDYYGPSGSGWTLIDIGWDDPSVIYAPDVGRSIWTSDAGSGGNTNLYRRGVWLNYERSVTKYQYQADYGATIDLPDYIKDYSGLAKYQGVVTKSTGTTTSYNNYTDWTVTVDYEGTVQAIDNPPVAQFTCKSQVFVGTGAAEPSLQSLVDSYGRNVMINDTSYDPDPWDSITETWAYSTDGGATYTNASSITSFNTPGTYKIRLTVKDTGNSPYSGPFTSTAYQTVKVYPLNHKPEAYFEIGNAQPMKTGDAISYLNVNMSEAGDSWDSITTYTWEWKNHTSSTWTSGKPASFATEGAYDIRLKVTDKGNNPDINDSLTSDWLQRTVIVQNNPQPMNIKMDSIEVVGASDNLPVTKMAYGDSYKIKIVLRNTELSDIKLPFDILYDFGSMGYEIITYSGNIIGQNNPITLYSSAFVANTTKTSESPLAYADYANFIPETNENDNAKKITLPLVNNRPPVASFTLTPNPQLSAQPITYNNTSSDPDGDALTNFWWYQQADSSGNFDTNDASVKWISTGSSPQSSFTVTVSTKYRIRLRVRDVNGAYSGYAYQDITVLPYSVKPTADFTVAPNPQLTGQALTYTDNSHVNDTWETIVQREWSWSKDGVTWNTAATPPSSLTTGDWTIRERVLGSGNSLSPGLWSDMWIKTIKILPYNTKPTANFTVTPNPQLFAQTLTYTDSSTPNDSWDALTTWEWSYSSDGGTTWSTAASTPPSSFNTPGAYKVRLRVKDTGNALSAALWSDYCIKDISILDQNIKAVSIDIVNVADTNPVATLQVNKQYRAKVVLNNTGNTTISSFKVDLKENGTLLSNTTTVTNLVAGTSTTVYITFTETSNGSRTFTSMADFDNAVSETNESDNTVSVTETSVKVNLKAVSIDVVGTADDISKTELQQGKQYRAKVSILNDGDTDLTNFVVGLYENGNKLTTSTVASLVHTAGSNSKNVYITFTASNRGTRTFMAKVDDSNIIDESDETDNAVSKDLICNRLNVKAVSIQLLDTNNVAVTSMIQGLQYKAAINVTNDGDKDLSSFNVGLYDNSSNTLTGAVKVGTTSLTLAKGASTTVNITFTANNRGTRTFIGFADDTNVLDETDETDNQVNASTTVNKVNVKAVSISVQDSNGVAQTSLSKGVPYNVKISLTNDGDVNLGAFNLGLYENGVRKSSVAITSLNIGITTTYTIAYTPQITGGVTLRAFADDNLQIDETTETDNQVSTVVTVNDLMITNYRISSMVNPPSTYSYPMDVTKMPVGVKAGYNVTFLVDVIGVADTVTADFSDSSTLNNKTISFTKIQDIDASHSVWQAVVNTDMNTPINTIVYSTVKGTKGALVYNYNTANSWGGQTLNIVGSALEDFIINRTY